MGAGPIPQESDALAVVVGDRLIVRRAIALPDVCMKCGAEDRPVERDERVFWFVAPWLYALFVLGPFGALGVLALTKTAALEIPLCDVCRAKWNAAASLRKGVSFVAIATTLVAVFLPLVAPNVGLAASIAVTFAGTLAIIATYAATSSRVMRATYIDPLRLTLSRVHPSAMARVCRDAKPAPERAARPTIRLAARLLAAHVLAYILAFSWTVAAIAIVIRGLPLDLDPELQTVAPLVLKRVAWPFVGVWIGVHVASLPWVMTREASRLKWTRALFFGIALATFLAAVVVGGVAWSRLVNGP